MNPSNNFLLDNDTSLLNNTSSSNISVVSDYSLNNSNINTISNISTIQTTPIISKSDPNTEINIVKLNNSDSLNNSLEMSYNVSDSLKVNACSSNKWTLSLDDIFINLKIIASIESNQKMRVSDNILNKEPCHYLQFVARWLSGDSRHKMVLFIGHVIECTFKYIEILKIKITDYSVNNYSSDFIQESQNRLQQLITHLVNCKQGLSNLKVTYDDDVSIKCTLEMLMDKIQDRITWYNSHIKLSSRPN